MKVDHTENSYDLSEKFDDSLKLDIAGILKNDNFNKLNIDSR